MNTEDFRLISEEIVIRPIKKTRLRERARQVIGPIIAELGGSKRKTIRKALRSAYGDFSNDAQRVGYPYKIWCEEVAIAMRERRRRPGSEGQPKPIEEIMPSMRGWAFERGMVEVPALFDVDIEEGAGQ